METPPPQSEILFAQRAKPKYPPLGKNPSVGKGGGGEGWKEQIAGDPRSLFGEGWRSLPEADPPIFSGEEEGGNRRVSSGRFAPPQLSSGAEGAPQSPHSWAGLFRGARTPPSYRQEPEEGGGSGAGRAPPPRQTPQDPCEREGRRGEEGPAQLRGWPLKKIKKKKKGEKKKGGGEKSKMIVFKRSGLFCGGRGASPETPGGAGAPLSSGEGAPAAPRERSAPLRRPRGGSGRRAPSPRAPREGGEAAAEPRALLSRKGRGGRGRSPAIPGPAAADTEGRGGRCCWRSRCPEAPAGGSPPRFPSAVPLSAAARPRHPGQPAPLSASPPCRVAAGGGGEILLPFNSEPLFL